MNLKTYEANTMAEALAKVRRELGRQAVILHTRAFKRGALFGLGGRRVVEIIASADVNVLHPAVRRNVLGAATETPLPPTRDDQDRPPIAPLQEELSLVKQMVGELVKDHRRNQHPAVPEELFSTYLSLINQEVAQELAHTIIRQVQSQLTGEELADETLVRDALAQCVEKMIPTAGPITAGRPGQPKVIAFVGPTGVGKTTTIAKLAANFKLRENKAVGLITIDTYRIAAVDQLRTYANIINVPLKVVLSPSELRDAIEAMKPCHVILIDTAGRSQNDAIKLRELKSFLDAARPDETHLVLSVTASAPNVHANIDKFAPLGIDKVAFTKLDEAVGIGMLLNVVQKLDRAISYITTGQNVPDDIEPGSGVRLARLLLDQCLGGDRSDVHPQPAPMTSSA